CDNTYAGVDAYVIYDKASDTYDNGGNVLAVEAEAANGEPVNLVIREGCEATEDWSCDPGTPVAKRYADLPPGRYVLAVSLDDPLGVWRGVTLRVHETRALPEGESGESAYSDPCATYGASVFGAW